MNSQIIFYASGMSSVADFEGFAQAGHPVGVMAQDVSARVSNKIWGYAAQGGRVFVDSGAFPAFIRGTAVDFDAVFDFYRELAGNCLFPSNWPWWPQMLLAPWRKRPNSNGNTWPTCNSWLAWGPS